MENRHPGVEILNLYTVKGTGNDLQSLKAASLVYSLDASKRYNF